MEQLTWGDIPFVSSSFPRQMVRGAWCFEAVTVELWGAMGKFVVSKKGMNGG